MTPSRRRCLIWGIAACACAAVVINAVVGLVNAGVSVYYGVSEPDASLKDRVACDDWRPSSPDDPQHPSELRDGVITYAFAEYRFTHWRRSDGTHSTTPSHFEVVRRNWLGLAIGLAPIVTLILASAALTDWLFSRKSRARLSSPP